MNVVRFGAVLSLALAALGAQDRYSTTSVDINGRRVVAGPDIVTQRSKTATETTEITQSINGRRVPLERVEEHVLRDDSSGKTIERIIHRYDLTGNALAPQKVVVEENKRPGGSSTVLTTTYSGDINGRMQVMERATTRTQVSGSAQTADTLLERPNINGGFDTIEKQNSVLVKQSNGGYQETAITFRRDPGGSFYPATRRITDHTETGSQSTDNTAEYEVGATGQLELHGQRVRKTEKRANGGADVLVDIFSKNVPGAYNDSSTLGLKEHQILERRPIAGGVSETLSVQRPTVSDPRKLGAPMQISETVCRGKCEPQP